ncbi:FGFR1 oncogene partner 2 homolog isoform X1 [Centruroides vittatus]|uniref:FGFR1 oncogene partner 2 homolog isoform X1 n=2 Tax=Centruroides vittatus TaxID=120091 RepID=UPI00350F1416
MCWSSLLLRIRRFHMIDIARKNMSLTVHQILNDAKRLVTRLRDHDNTADTIIAQAQSLNKTVESMNEYNEDLAELNTSIQQRPRSSLILNIQQENRHIRELQQENRELRNMLEEYQSVLELIMSKYRQQVTKLVQSTSVDRAWGELDNYKELQEQADRICDMAAIIKQAIEIDEGNYAYEQERLTQLLTENKGLRELLEISRTSGSLGRPSNAPDTTEKEVQTDT